ncbi:MAG: tripartite tricarboxylate transporter substrate binding protein [Ideonella sp.]
MSRINTSIAVRLAACLLAPLSISVAASEHKFDEPLRIIAPAAPGGILDQTSRVVAKALTEVLKQSVLVENAPGAGGTIGIQAMLRAKPDGNTLVMGSLGPNSANYTLYQKLPYKAEDMIPVIHVLSMPNVLVASTQLGAKTIADLKALSKSRPGGLSMAVSTTGSSGHLTGELFKSRAGINAVNVVYRGAAPALTDLLAGRVDLMVDNLITSLPHIRAGKLVPIAVTSRERIAELPDVPTLVEAGYPDLEVAVWLGIFVSAKTPPATVAALNAALQKALSSAEVREQFAKWGGVAVGGTPESFHAFVSAEKDRWAKVIRASDIKVD